MNLHIIGTIQFDATGQSCCGARDKGDDALLLPEGVDAAITALKGGETSGVKQQVGPFLAKRGTDSPDMVVEMLSGIKDDTNEIKVDTDSEKAVETFSEVERAKKTEIPNLPNSPVAERRMKAIRERQVDSGGGQSETRALQAG